MLKLQSTLLSCCSASPHTQRMVHMGEYQTPPMSDLHTHWQDKEA